MMNVAQHILSKCGGAKQVAEWLQLKEPTVYRWTYNKPRGTGGHVPADHQVKLLNIARENGIDLTPADFFPTDEEAA